MPSNPLLVRRGASHRHDAIAALDEVCAAIDVDASVVLLFVGSGHDLDALGPAIGARFACPVIACTTAGELSPDGYDERSLTGVSLTSPRLHVRAHRIDRLADLQAEQLSDVARAVSGELATRQRESPRTRAFGLLLVDGLSCAEENVIAQLSAALPEVPLFGGSAGDGLRFERTHVYAEGRFHPSIAVLAVFTTDLPFQLFRTQHFEPLADRRLVITEATPEQRIVKEINGYPAAEEYARLLGLDVRSLDPMVFSTHPLLLRVGGEYYVRSIQKVNEDRSLTFFCAIDEGLVLTLSRGLDIVENLERALSDVERSLPSASVVLACECILRRLEVIDKHLLAPTQKLLERHRVIGFHTYGEQFDGLHVNQTMVGVAIGGREP